MSQMVWVEHLIVWVTDLTFNVTKSWPTCAATYCDFRWIQKIYCRLVSKISANIVQSCSDLNSQKHVIISRCLEFEDKNLHWFPCPALFIILGDSSVWHPPNRARWLRMDWCFVWGGTVTLDQGLISGSFLVATGSGTGWRGGGRRGGGPRGGPGGGAEGGQRGGHFRSDQASRELPSCALHGGPELA